MEKSLSNAGDFFSLFESRGVLIEEKQIFVL